MKIFDALIKNFDKKKFRLERRKFLFLIFSTTLQTLFFPTDQSSVSLIQILDGIVDGVVDGVCGVSRNNKSALYFGACKFLQKVKNLGHFLYFLIFRPLSCTSELPLKVNCRLKVKFMIKFGLAWPTVWHIPAQILSYDSLSVYKSLSVAIQWSGPQIGSKILQTNIDNETNLTKCKF